VEEVVMQAPELPSNVNKTGTMVMPPDKVRRRFKIKDEIRSYQSDNRNKIIVLQRIEFENGREEIRLGYYIIGKKPRMKGRWVWGQYATMMPLRDFRELIRRAEGQGWF
jgi:hypothetical protein